MDESTARNYTRGDKAWYAEANKIFLPDFSFSGRTEGEFYVRQVGDIGLHLEVFGDGCALLAYEYLDLILWLAAHENATGDELEAWLLSQGVEDATLRES